MATPLKTMASNAVVTLELPPSCAQFCPAHPEYFVVGTYNLEAGNGEGGEDAGHVETEATATAAEYQSRNGSLVVFKTDGSTL
jgi:diphthine methyl ester acylhydrolase